MSVLQKHNNVNVRETYYTLFRRGTYYERRNSILCAEEAGCA